MNRKISSIALFLAVSIWTASCHIYREPFTILVVSGTPQSTLVGTTFGAPLVVQVLSKAGRPVHNAAVTFTPPSSGASATTSNTTIFTDAHGMATSGTVTANDTAGAYQVLASVIGVAEPAVFNLTNTAGSAAGLACTGGTGQSTQVDTPFGSPLGAQVVDSQGNPVNDAGVVVTFTPPAQTGPSLTFAGGVNTATTNATGLATSVTITANGNVGGPYNVSASATIADAVQTCPTPFSLTNTAIPVTTENFVFYASGMETGPRFYSVAGVVTIETSGPNPGQVMGGEQDYNDGDGITSPQPSGDTITGGQLAISSTTGQGTLTLVTNNQQVGGGISGGVTAAGTEEFAVQFVNANHALVTQFDGSATSSGSLDLQSSTSAPSGSFAFTLSGVDPGYCPIVVGGVFTISGGSFSGGTFDYNDCGDLVTGTAFPTGAAGGTVGASDASGRGSITDFAVGITLRYYVVGAEAIRIIDVDSTAPKIPYDSAVGSAFGQGSGGAFSNSSLGTFVFADSTNPWNAFYDAAGMLTTNPDAGTFQGVADNDEAGVVYSRVTIPSEGSSYSICGSAACGGNGYGSLTIPAEVLGDIGLFGVYMTDPNLNLNDPNNTASGTGGALITDLELIGTGVIVPQTSTSKPSAGNYAFGAQGFNPSNNDEYDFVGQGSVAAKVLTGSGDIADPFLFFDTKNALFTGASFTGTATADAENPGRYTISPLAVTPPVEGDSPTDFTVVLYQANGTQLFWMDEDTFSYFLGPVEQQAAVVTPLPSAKVKAQAQPIQKK